ncbi:50S ribosomal protein L25 [candidate division Kazan bacterium]|uniref:Large ribosomal subunit protein bL25 n=1 Tax=candidate division Kazan bacterium TaxID=2202143 RepID=A0A420ZDH7_UNCK3|nr:MAG: 50S ribosomal protein L25 [candidate division Kazan bacterium]
MYTIASVMVIGEYTIEAKLRDKQSTASFVRKLGNIPAVIYGKETEPLSVQIDSVSLKRLYREAGESSLVQLKLDDEERLILFKEPQYDPRTGEIIHIDLYQIKLGESIKAEVQLVFEGEAPAVEQEDGVLVTNKDKVEIECLPRDLPKDIKVDISGLKNIDDSLAIKDLQVPEGVKILDDPEDSVVVVTPPREEEEEPAVSEDEAIEDVEVEGEEKAAEAGSIEEDKGETEAADDKAAKGGEDTKGK